MIGSTTPVSSGSPNVGISVAIHGDTIAVGASGVTTPNGAYYGGELFVYRKPGTGWHNTSHWDAVGSDENAEIEFQLGISAAIYRDTLVTAAYAAEENLQGAVYVFTPHWR